MTPYSLGSKPTAGIDFSPDHPPSSLQLFKLLANSEFRKGVQKLRDDLVKAGVNVEPEVRASLGASCNVRMYLMHTA